MLRSRWRGDDSAAAYELLRIARDLFAQIGDVPGAMQAAKMMDERFILDGLALRLETLKLFQKSPQASQQQLVTAAWPLVFEAAGTVEYCREPLFTKEDFGVAPTLPPSPPPPVRAMFDEMHAAARLRH